MRYPISEKLEIIRTVKQSHLSAKRTLDQLGMIGEFNLISPELSIDIVALGRISILLER